MSDEYAAGESWPLLPDGTYEAQAVRYDAKTFSFGKQLVKKLFVRFRIINEGEHHGTEIFIAYNMPPIGPIKSGRKYYKDWVMINGYQRPSRNAKMSPRLFVHKIFRIRTRTVKPERNGEQMPATCWYSCVDALMEVISDGGTPAP